jgi:hypothetical protein
LRETSIDPKIISGGQTGADRAALDFALIGFGVSRCTVNAQELTSRMKTQRLRKGFARSQAKPSETQPEHGQLTKAIDVRIFLKILDGNPSQRGG